MGIISYRQFMELTAERLYKNQPKAMIYSLYLF